MRLLRIGIWNSIPQVMIKNLAYLFKRCLKKSRFPDIWKIAKLILIPKVDSNKFRPICLIDDIEKVFEIIISNRLKEHINNDPRAKLSNFKYGFREERSTTDSFMVAKELIDNAINKIFTVAVSIDIKNTFNILPWDTIFK